MANTFFYFALLIIFHFSMPTFSKKPSTILTDQSALLALKDHVISDPENVLTSNWSVSTPVCNWIGVRCGSKHRRVTALDLTGLGLVGTLPPHLGNLSFLSLLSIRNNSFHGRLPVQLSKLRRLKYLNLGDNSLSGEIPSWLGSLTELRSLFLYQNNFNSSIPLSLGYLPKLEMLILYENQISGSIPSSIFNISSLQGIHLRNNLLSGSIPSISRDLLSLERIDFTYNNLTGHIPKDMFDYLPNVKGLYWSFNLLSGKIPASLCKCKDLQFLSLSHNQLEGSLPAEIGNLSMLRHLYIGENHFEGEIPASLFKCKKLQVISLQENQLEGSLPLEIGNLSMLQTFSVRQNHFEGEIPKEIGNLTLFKEFDCEYNNFTGTIPPQIGNLKNLESLGLGGNNIGGPIPLAIFNISTLSMIDFNSNKLSGHRPSNMGLWLPKLEALYLGANHLVGPFPMSISNASQLIHLSMPGNYISGSIPENLGNLRNLRWLNLEANNLTSSGMSFLSSLTKCRGLEYLYFDLNPLIDGKLPGLVGNLSASLEEFTANDCNIRGSIPSEIGNLSLLIELDLGGNKLTGSVPTTIGGLKELQSVSLSYNKLEGSIPSELCHLNKLAFLDLTSNKLSGPLPACLGDLISLRNLFLGSNMFSSSIPSTLTRLGDLLLLNLSSNSLIGPLPNDIGKWKVVTTKDLSSNQFSGDIPIGIVDLKDLTYFSLSNNQITGFIPKSFGELLSLGFLDLSRNNLSGQIPKTLEKLSYLRYFNVSFNRLQGEIPRGGSFENFSIESFKGNEALCGAPQLHLPSCKSKPLKKSKARTKLIIYVALPIAFTLLVAVLIFFILQSRKRKDKLSTQENVLPLGSWKRISYHELHQATDGFNESKLLGNGSYGSVYQGTLSDGMTFTVKVFEVELERALKSFDIECEVFRNTRHRNLVKIISSCSNDLDFKALVLEFMPNGSLDKWLYSNDHSFDILQRMNIMIDVASALEYLHHGNATPIVHCDLKPSNVLLDEDIVAHLNDFGITKLLCNDDSLIQTMTMATVGHQYGTEGIVSTKGDVYSFGILMMETITRKRPTDDIFVGERSLKSWVKESISSSLNQVVDSDLLGTIGRERSAVNNCALSILQVGLECSAELPDERLDMKEIVTKLKKIKAKLLKDTERVR